MPTRVFATLGMFIINKFAFLDDVGAPSLPRDVPPPRPHLPCPTCSPPPQIGGGSTYAALGTHLWCVPSAPAATATAADLP